MPIYEYLCPHCQTEFQLTRPFSQSQTPARCPKCGREARKLPSVFASGWSYDLKIPAKPAFRGKPKPGE